MKPASLVKYLSLAFVVFALAAPGAVFASGTGKPASGGANTVEIKEYKYTPATLTVHAGATVTWINHDQIPHTIVEKNKVFRSAALDTNDKYTYTFKKAGTYTYFCSLHPQMTGTVVVKP